MVEVLDVDYNVTLDNTGGVVEAVNARLGCRARGISLGFIHPEPRARVERSGAEAEVAL